MPSLPTFNSSSWQKTIRNHLEALDEPALFARLSISVTAIALLARMGGLLARWSSWNWQRGFVADGWNLLAINLANSGTFGFAPGESTIARGPFFPFLELPLYWMFGERYAAWAIALLLLDTATCTLIILLARKHWGNRTALLAGLFYALYLPVIHYTANISQFTSILPLVFLWFFMFTLWDADPLNKRLPWGLGIVSGLLILNKTVYLLAPFMGVCALFLFHGWAPTGRLRLVRGAAVYLVVTAAVVAPWTFRNYVVTGGSLIPVQKMTWQIVWQDIALSELDATRGRNLPEGETLDYMMSEFSKLMNQTADDTYASLKGPNRELYEDKLLEKETTEWIKHNPLRYMKNVLNNTWEFWVRAENLKKTLEFSAMQAVYLGATAFGLWALIVSRRIYQVRFGLLLILLIWAEHVPVIGWGRHSLDLVPILAIIFGLGIDSWLRGGNSARRDSTSRFGER